MKPKSGRPQTSPHGMLFGGDSLYEVLAALTASRRAKFSVSPTGDRTVIPLADTIRRTPSQTRKEVRKLQRLGVLEEVERKRKTEVYAVTPSKISESILSLPELLVARLGAYRRHSS